MTTPITTDNRPIVGAYGDVYTAPVGTPPPTDLSNPGAPWVKLGLVSEDGATWTPPEEETEEISAWQLPYPVRIVTTSLTTSVAFALMEWDRDTIPFALGGGEFEDSGDVVIFHPPAPGESVSRALFLMVLDSPIQMGLYYPKGRITSREDATFKKDEAALLSVEFGIEGDVNYDPYQLLFGADTFPEGAITATGATAGSPGAWTPAGATAPADLAALQGAAPPVVANPATLWTTGQHMVLGDSTTAHWDSDSWAGGQAP